MLENRIRNRDLLLISELRKVKFPFSLFRQRAANFQISTIWANALHWHIQNKFCLSKNGIARQYYISLEKEHYDIGTHLDFRQENDIRITTLQTQQKQCCNKVVTTLVFGFSNDVGNTTLWQCWDNVIRHRDQNTTKT